MISSKLFSFLGITKKDSPELLLKKIHFKRLKIHFPIIFLKEIENEYIKTNDVRIFNELLWICGGETQKIPESIKKFNTHFKNGKYEHDYDPNLLNLDYKNIKINNIDFENNSVALIGNPLFFILPYYKLLKYGIKPDIIHVKYHPNKYLKKIFSSFSIVYRVIFKKRYFQIDIDNKSQINKFKLTKKYDIGFHKLSFIIKENIISSFKKGLINDHWGALPFVKGRSTLLYSKLLGVPQIITTHLIEKNIDSGEIINYYPLKNKHIKFQILSGLSSRILESLYLLSKMKFRETDNRKGFIFYEMHPWLIKKINKSKL